MSRRLHIYFVIVLLILAGTALKMFLNDSSAHSSQISLGDAFGPVSLFVGPFVLLYINALLNKGEWAIFSFAATVFTATSYLLLIWLDELFTVVIAHYIFSLVVLFGLAIEGTVALVRMAHCLTTKLKSALRALYGNIR